MAAILAIAVASVGVAVVTAPAASAAPRPVTGKQAPPVTGKQAPKDDEGGTKELTDQLDEATSGYLKAKDALAASQNKQKLLTTRLTEIDGELVTRSGSISKIVNQAYRTGRLGPMSAMLNAGSPDGFLDRATTLDLVAVKEDRALRDLQESQKAQEQAKLAVEAEIRTQTKQLNLMNKRKAQAEGALKAANVGEPAGGSGGSGSSSKASAARRNSDGSLPGEGCSRNDPTTSGCISPRTLHAMQEAKSDGFTRFVSCFRPSGSGEHPKGRACDFASDKGGFGGVAKGSSRTYGNNLAEYFIDNADRLGVLYVIWFKRIWLPSSGWKTYSRGNGDPSSDHTNHVHLSMR
jgi:hypothetical protein